MNTVISPQIDSRRTGAPEAHSRELDCQLADSQVAGSQVGGSQDVDAQDANTHATVPEQTDGRRLLIITAIAGAASCALELGAQLGFPADSVATRRDGLAAMRTRNYSAVVIDDAIAGSDPAGVELLRKHAGAAAFLEVNFVLSSAARVSREVRWELLRLKQEQGLAMRLAYTAIQSELRATVTGLLLHSQLALGEPGVTAQLSTKLHMVVQLAADLGKRLERSSRAAAGA